jgi:flagellar motor switch protein FliM
MSGGDTATATGEAVATSPARGRVKVYDFRRPDKFSRDQIRTVAIMHETFARQATTGLSSMLRVMAHVHEASVDQMTYEEFIRSIPNPTVLGVVNMDPLKGPAVLQMDPGLVEAMVDRLFGGPGVPVGENRELTDIECSVIEGLYERTLPTLREAWATILDIQPRLGAIETNPAFCQIVPPQEMIVLVTFEAQVGEGKGMINLVLPNLTIEPVIPMLTAEYVYRSMKAPSAASNPAATVLPAASEVCYEGDRVALSALQTLRRGSLVRIPAYGTGEATLWAGGAPVIELAARTPGSDVNGWVVRAVRDAKALPTAGAAASAPEPLAGALSALAAQLGDGLRGLGDRVAELARRQEELAEQLAFPTTAETEQQGAEPARKRPFGFLTIALCDLLGAFLSREHPQLIALVLSYLEPGLAACVLEKVPLELRAVIASRICAMDRISPEVLRHVEAVLERKLSAISREEARSAGGVGAMVEILNVGSRGLEKHVVETLEKTDPALAEEIKKRMFVFEDIVLLQKVHAAAVLKAASETDVVLALKAVPDKVRAFVTECLPRALAESLPARLEALGSVRLSDVDAAQQRVVATIRTMEEEGKIFVARPDEVVG